MPKLAKNPTLGDLQVFIQQLVVERDWDSHTVAERFLLFSEEVGELARSIRDQTNLKSKKPVPREHLEEEFADVLSYLLDLANQFDVDLEQAFRDKQQRNETRIWE